MRYWRAVCGAGMISLMLACGPRSDLTVEVRGSFDDPASVQGLEIHVQGMVFTGSDFVTDENGRLRRSFEVPNDGQLPVTVLLTRDRQEVVRGEMTFTLSEGYDWWIQAFRQSTDPREPACFGCIGVERLKIDPALALDTEDSIWFTWGGEPKGSDVVY